MLTKNHSEYFCPLSLSLGLFFVEKAFWVWFSNNSNITPFSRQFLALHPLFLDLPADPSSVPYPHLLGLLAPLPFLRTLSLASRRRPHILRPRGPDAGDAAGAEAGSAGRDWGRMCAAETGVWGGAADEV